MSTHEVVIDKLVHGGQGIGTLDDGRKVFAWNVLPGERVVVDAAKNKKKYLEGVATDIMESSPDRVEPKDEAYLSTSPWQMMNFAAENRHKQAILEETFRREHVEWKEKIPFHAGVTEWHYRNKMEYSFWADDEGLHLALFHRASHGKRIITGSSIAMPKIDQTANAVLAILNQNNIRGSQLKTVVVRCNQAGQTVVALFVKDENFPKIREFSEVAKGLVVYFSNPRSPASLITKELYGFGDVTLIDTLGTRKIRYDVNSFFQVNLEIFSQALARIAECTEGIAQPIDMYSGVGTIGLSIGRASVLVDSDPHNCEMARRNAKGQKATVIEAPAEKALDYIDSEHSLIVDPPRAGLHSAVTQRIREVLPPRIIYLSCNPITQARDVALLQDLYSLRSLEGYNFFPRTPHIESLVVLERKS